MPDHNQDLPDVTDSVSLRASKAVRASAPSCEHIEWAPALAPTTRTLAGFMQVREFDAQDVAAWPNSMSQLRAGSLHAVVVHGVLNAHQCEDVISAANAASADLPQASFPTPFRSSFIGRNLNLAHPSLTGYFEDATKFNAWLEGASAPPGLAPKLRSVLSSMDNGAPVEAAMGPLPGQHYMFTTLRRHLPGGFIPPHFDNEQRFRPAYRHLAPLLEPSLLSFVLALRCAESGGALEVFDCRCETPQASLFNDDRSGPATRAEQVSSVRFRLPAGSLIVLDSGRLLHQLTPIEGERERWAVCSFMARRLGTAATWCWG